MRKKILFIASFVAIGFASMAQTAIFSENFEGKVDGTLVSEIPITVAEGSPITAFSRYTFRESSYVIENETAKFVTNDKKPGRQGIEVTNVSELENNKVYTFTANVKSSTPDDLITVYIRFKGAADATLAKGESTAADFTTFTATITTKDLTGLTAATFEVNGSVVSQIYYVKDWSITVEDYDPGLSEDGLSLAKLSVYPNPSNGIFQIESDSKVNSYSVFDTTGKLVKSVEESTHVDISESLPGLYFLQVKFDDGKSQVIKAVVK